MKKKSRARSPAKREARFRAVPWADDDFYRMHAGIHASWTLDPGDKLKLGELLQQAHIALSGRPAVDVQLQLAAYTMGHIDIWNALVRTKKIRHADAVRMIARRPGVRKTARAISAALKRPPYDQIRAECAADPRNVDCRVPGDLATAPAFATVLSMVESKRVRESLTETAKYWERLAAGFDELAALTAKADAIAAIPRAARGGRR